MDIIAIMNMRHENRYLKKKNLDLFIERNGLKIENDRFKVKIAKLEKKNKILSNHDILSIKVQHDHSDISHDFPPRPSYSDSIIALLDEIQKDNEVLKKENLNLLRDIDDLKIENGKFKVKIEELKKEVLEKKVLLVQLVHDLRTEIGILKEKILSLPMERDGLKYENDKFKVKMEELELERIKGDEVLKKDHSILSKEIDSLKSENDKLKVKIGELEKKKNENEFSTNMLEEENENLFEENKSLREYLELFIELHSKCQRLKIKNKYLKNK